MAILNTGFFHNPVSLSRLALFFLGGLGILLLLFGALFFTDLARLERSITASNKKLAQLELTEAVTLLELQARAIGAKVADWDEARQQIVDPAYYALWRNSRAMTAGILPASTLGIELYDLDGKGFSRASDVKKSAMPPRVNKRDLRVLFRKDEGQDALYYFFPIYADISHQQQIGFGGLKLDFAQELNLLRRFRYVDLGSIQVAINDDKFHRIHTLVEVMTYRTLPVREITELKSLIFRLIYGVTATVVGGALLAYLFVVVLVVRPLRRLSNHIDASRAGRGGLLSESYRGPVPISELENVRLSLNEYQSRLENMHDNLASKNDELWQLAHHDPLTGIYNRRSFEEDWGDLMAASATSQINASFLLFDCDHFKPINDTYGHPVGDSVIRGIVEALHSALRDSDRLYRMGGDEFATLLHKTDVDTAQIVAERCINAVNKHDFLALGVKSRSASVSALHMRKTQRPQNYSMRMPIWRCIWPSARVIKRFRYLTRAWWSRAARYCRVLKRLRCMPRLTALNCLKCIIKKLSACRVEAPNTLKRWFVYAMATNSFFQAESSRWSTHIGSNSNSIWRCWNASIMTSPLESSLPARVSL